MNFVKRVFTKVRSVFSLAVSYVREELMVFGGCVWSEVSSVFGWEGLVGCGLSLGVGLAAGSYGLGFIPIVYGTRCPGRLSNTLHQMWVMGLLAAGYLVFRFVSYGTLIPFLLFGTIAMTQLVVAVEERYLRYAEEV